MFKDKDDVSFPYCQWCLRVAHRKQTKGGAGVEIKKETSFMVVKKHTRASQYFIVESEKRKEWQSSA